MDDILKIPSSLKERIVDKIKSARLTIIVGSTGCGKSTLVPQLLLDKFGALILCTQPRRLAVVAVSNHVAKQRGTALGQEVGYHIGQTRLATRKTGLLFATAGILLEELRSTGINALSKYKVILIDECHERSAESDLCLTIIKSFMKGHRNIDFRVVLMSATFNHGRYTSYFNGVPGCEIIDTITLDTGGSIAAFYSRVLTFYLEDIIKMIPTQIRDNYLKDFVRQMRLDPNLDLAGDDRGKTLSQSLLTLIATLVIILHQEEEDDAIFLIFAPTYRHLEQIYETLNQFNSKSSHLLINVLHSSIDIEDCLDSMQFSNKESHGRYRRILLASAIADSSVTIPGVTCVIDTCRALEVRWFSDKEVYVPKTVWASKSICDQRRGRTGRTCPGRVFRLLNQSFYINQLTEWDQPQIELASCRDEVLALLSSTNKLMADPQALLKRCMDPPPKASLNKAIKYLENIGACKTVTVSQKTRLVPTDYGKLLAALPYTVTDACMIVKGARNGLLHEALTLVSILSTRPFPIVHVFGETEHNEEVLSRYYSDANPKDPKIVALANLAAYFCWHIKWNTRIRGDAAKRRFLRCTNELPKKRDVYIFESSPQNDEFSLYPDKINDDDRHAHDCNVWNWSIAVEEAHSRWCEQHSINSTSVRAISTSVDVAMKILYKEEHEPDWLRLQKSEPKWNLQCVEGLAGNPAVCRYDIFGEIYGHVKGIEVCSLLVDLQDKSKIFDTNLAVDTVVEAPTQVVTACIHFLKGNCSFGARCRYLHSLDAPRPLCRFFETVGCTNSNCLYLHTHPNTMKKEFTNPQKNAVTYSKYNGGVLAWYKNNARHLLLFGEADFSFSRALSRLNMPPLVATTYDSQPPASMESYCDLTDVDATRCHVNKKLIALLVDHHITSCVWNFPFDEQDENEVVQTALLSGTFMSVAQYFLSERSARGLGSEGSFEFGIALQGNQFTRWSIMQSARRAGFNLDWWGIFDHEEFPGYHPRRGNGDCFPVQNGRFYVFNFKCHD